MILARREERLRARTERAEAKERARVRREAELAERRATADERRKTAARNWRERNPGHNRRWKAENPDRVREIRRRANLNNPEARRAAKQRRRALLRGAEVVGRVTLREVALRDGWRCHICRGRVTEAEWSLDHLVPLSVGGAHSMENVALAHHRCNSRRGVDRLPAQLRLVG